MSSTGGLQIILQPRGLAAQEFSSIILGDVETLSWPRVVRLGWRLQAAHCNLNQTKLQTVHVLLLQAWGVDCLVPSISFFRRSHRFVALVRLECAEALNPES